VDYAKCIVDFSFHAIKEEKLELEFGKSFNEKMVYVVEEEDLMKTRIAFILEMDCNRKIQRPSYWQLNWHAHAASIPNSFFQVPAYI